MQIKRLLNPITGGLLLIMVFFAACKPSDAKIAESVKEKISAISTSISSDVKDGVVTLSGQVADDATKAAAETSLTGLKGVKSVVNNITVPPPPAPPVVISPDEILRKSVDSVFAAKGISGVTAAVSNSEVTLTGSVKKDVRVKAMQAVNEVHPKKVINQITDIK